MKRQTDLVSLVDFFADVDSFHVEEFNRISAVRSTLATTKSNLILLHLSLFRVVPIIKH